MAIKLFTVEKQKALPTEHCFTIKWLKRIIDEFPNDYMDIYYYLHCMTCPIDNPFIQTPEEDKEISILKSIEAQFDPEEESILFAKEEMIKLYKSPSIRAWKAAKKTLDKLSQWLDTTPITAGRDGSVNEVRATLKQLPDLRDAYNKLYQDVQEEQGKVRGGQNLSYDSEE